MSAAYMVKNRPSEFTDILNYVNAFAEKVAVTDRISQRVVKEEYGRSEEISVLFNLSHLLLCKILSYCDHQVSPKILALPQEWQKL